MRLIRTFDCRQQCDLHRHPALFDLLDDVIKVQARALDLTIHIPRILGKPLLVIVDTRIIEWGQVKAGADAIPDVVILPRCGLGIVCDHRNRAGKLIIDLTVRLPVVLRWGSKGARGRGDGRFRLGFLGGEDFVRKLRSEQWRRTIGPVTSRAGFAVLRSGCHDLRSRCRRDKVRRQGSRRCTRGRRGGGAAAQGAYAGPYRQSQERANNPFFCFNTHSYCSLPNPLSNPRI